LFSGTILVFFVGNSVMFFGTWAAVRVFEIWFRARGINEAHNRIRNTAGDVRRNRYCTHGRLFVVPEYILAPATRHVLWFSYNQTNSCWSFWIAERNVRSAVICFSKWHHTKHGRRPVTARLVQAVSRSSRQRLCAAEVWRTAVNKTVS